MARRRDGPDAVSPLKSRRNTARRCKQTSPSSLGPRTSSSSITEYSQPQEEKLGLTRAFEVGYEKSLAAAGRQAFLPGGANHQTAKTRRKTHETSTVTIEFVLRYGCVRARVSSAEPGNPIDARRLLGEGVAKQPGKRRPVRGWIEKQLAYREAPSSPGKTARVARARALEANPRHPDRTPRSRRLGPAAWPSLVRQSQVSPRHGRAGEVWAGPDSLSPRLSAPGAVAALPNRIHGTSILTASIPTRRCSSAAPSSIAFRSPNRAPVGFAFGESRSDRAQAGVATRLPACRWLSLSANQKNRRGWRRGASRAVRP